MSIHGNSSTQKLFRICFVSKIAVRAQITLCACVGQFLKAITIQATSSMVVANDWFDVAKKSYLRWNYVAFNELNHPVNDAIQ